MRNETLIKAGRDILKGLLIQCTEGQQLIFKKMYSNHHNELPIDEVVDSMNPYSIDTAISQCERTVKKN